MEDIKLNSIYKKIQHKVSWLFFIICGTPLAWVIAIALNTYGSDTTENKKKEEGILNLTYQKFIYVLGQFLSFFVIFMLVWNIVF